MFLLAAEGKQIQMLAEHGILKYEKASIHSPSPTPFTPFSYININIIRSDPIYISKVHCKNRFLTHEDEYSLSHILLLKQVQGGRQEEPRCVCGSGSRFFVPKAQSGSPPIFTSYCCFLFPS